ncbi:hypothetical protein ACJX0J_034381, partial [Zea mays]
MIELIKTLLINSQDIEVIYFYYNKLVYMTNKELLNYIYDTKFLCYNYFHRSLEQTKGLNHLPKRFAKVFEINHGQWYNIVDSL